jgi:hypothetical protein
MENDNKQKDKKTVETWMSNLIVQTGISKSSGKNWKELPRMDGEIKPVRPFKW